MVAPAEDREEIVKLQAPDTRELELQQGVLARVGIHRMNAPGSGQGIVEDIAPGAGDDQHGVVAVDVQRQAVHCRVFPAGVVDQRPRVDGIEQSLVETVRKGMGGLERHGLEWLPQCHRGR